MKPSSPSSPTRADRGSSPARPVPVHDARPALPPPAIPAHPVVRVVHPCGAIGEHVESVAAGAARLEAAGCRVRWDEARARACWRGYLAGDDDTRAAELVDALSEPEVDIVWFARGGSGGARIAARVEEAARRAPPRVVVGFSDATVFLNRLAAERVVFHGPMVTSLVRPDITTDLDAILAVLRGERTSIAFSAPPLCTAGPVEGRLVGGNLTVLAASAGTPVAPTPGAGDIWLVEDVGEAPYRLDRAFWQLRAAGWLDAAAAVWLGDLALAAEPRAVAEVMFAADSPCPVITGAPAGHTGVVDVLPIGGSGRLDPEAGTFTATRPWVERR